MKAFSEQQIEKIKDYKIFTYENIKWFLEEYTISFRTFKRRSNFSGLKIPHGYSYSEYLNNQKLQSPFNKSYLEINCELCGKTYIAILFGFHKRKHKQPVCDVCYRKNFLYDETWRKNNSEAQKIAQNRPEVLEKQVNSQRKRHAQPGMKEKYCEIGKKLWEDVEYRKKFSR
jgi:hypothetical protein